MKFHLYLKDSAGTWQHICTVDEPNPRAAAFAAMSLLRPEHAKKPLKLVGDSRMLVQTLKLDRSMRLSA